MAEGFVRAWLASAGRDLFSWKRRKQAEAWLARLGYTAVNLDVPQRRDKFTRIDRVAREGELAVSRLEAFQLLSVVEATRNVPGAAAELGVYRGGTARLIGETKGDRALHLFDTFEGLPEVDVRDHEKFSSGAFAGSLFEVEARMRGIDGVHFHVGRFPESTESVRDLRFSFVHLDADLYRSTKDALEFFFDRLSPGGVLLAHDWEWADGVRRAFAEFFSGRPEPVIPVTGTSQCLVVK